MTKPTTSTSIIFCFACAAFNLAGAQAETFTVLESQVKRDNNVGNARLRFAVTDTATITSLQIGNIAIVGDNPSIWAVGGLVSKTDYQHLDGLDHLDLGGSLDFKRKLGIGPYAPQFGAKLSYERQIYNQADRTQNVQRFELHGNQRVSEALNLRLQWSTNHHHGSENDSVEDGLLGSVYEQRYRQWSIAADYSVFGDHLLSVNYGRRTGDLVVTTIADSPAIYGIAKAIRPDPSFGPDRDAYRLDGEIKTWGLSYRVPLSREWTLIADRQQHDSTVKNGITYSRKVYSLSVRYQF